MEIKPNNIYLGDCYELIKMIPDKSIDLIYTDIPYQFLQSGGGGAFGYKNREYLNKIRFWEEKMKSAKTKDEYTKARIQKEKHLVMENTKDINTGIDWSILDEFVRVQKNIYIYIWCSKSQIPTLIKYFVEERNCNFDILVWCKTNCTPMTNNTFLPNIEHCLFFREKNNPRRLEGEMAKKSKWYLSGTNVRDKKDFGHPTIKPLELVKRHIEIATKENDIVLDPFVGSGTTCKASQELNRQYIGFEIDEKYYKIAKDRLNGINARGEISLF